MGICFFFFPTENRKYGLRYFVLYCFQLILHEMRGGAVNCTLSLLLFTSGRLTPVVKIKEYQHCLLVVKLLEVLLVQNAVLIMFTEKGLQRSDNSIDKN